MLNQTGNKNELIIKSVNFCSTFIPLTEIKQETQVNFYFVTSCLFKVGLSPSKKMVLFD